MTPPFRTRAKPYFLDIGSIDSIETLKTRLPAVLSNADYMLTQLYEDLNAVANGLLARASGPLTGPGSTGPTGPGGPTGPTGASGSNAGLTLAQVSARVLHEL